MSGARRHDGQAAPEREQERAVAENVGAARNATRMADDGAQRCRLEEPLVPADLLQAVQDIRLHFGGVERVDDGADADPLLELAQGLLGGRRFGSSGWPRGTI